MNKIVGFGLAAAAVAVAALIGIQLLGGTNPGGPPPAPPPSPSADASAAPTADASVDTAGLVAGTTVQVDGFSEPFTFTMPEFPASDPPKPVVLNGEGSTSPDDPLRLSSVTWGTVSFHDDQSLPANLCQPTGARIDDVPATPDAVGAWLQSSTGLEVSAAETLILDGGSALRWDVTLPEGVCDGQSEVMGQGVTPPWFAAGEDHGVYAVPTGTDTILVFTWGVDWMGLSEEYGNAVNDATDDLVRSLTFGN